MSFLCSSGKRKKGEKKVFQGYHRSNDYDHIINYFNPPSNSQRNETKLKVVHDYLPCSAVEIPVKAGEIVTHIKSDGDWVFIRACNGADGYIPRRHCCVIENDIPVKQCDRYTDYRRHYVSTNLPHAQMIQDGCFEHHHSLETDYFTISSGSPSSSDSCYSNHKLSVDKEWKCEPVCGRRCEENCEHRASVTSYDAPQKNPDDSNLATNVSEPLSTKVKENIRKSKEESFSNDKGAKTNEHIKPQMLYASCGHPELIVIERYDKRAATDISIAPGDFACIINDTKHEQWIYIENETGERGYVPTECVLKHQCKECGKSKKSTSKDTSREPNFNNLVQMVAIKNFSGEQLDDFYVCLGDLVYRTEDADMSRKVLWVYSPKYKQSGYVPRLVVQDTSGIDTHANV